jgi:hypothetical protein
MAMGRSSRRSGHGRRALRALWRPEGNACREKRILCRIMGQRDKMRQAQDSPGTSVVVQTSYLRGVAMGKAVARILPLQRTAPDGAALAQGIRHTASKPIVKGAYDKGPQEQDTRLIGPGERHDLVCTASTPGLWLFHCHVVPHVTNDGAYPGGLPVPVVTEARQSAGRSEQVTLASHQHETDGRATTPAGCPPPSLIGQGKSTPLGHLILSLGYALAGRAPPQMRSDAPCRMADL